MFNIINAKQKRLLKKQLYKLSKTVPLMSVISNSYMAHSKTSRLTILLSTSNSFTSNKFLRRNIKNIIVEGLS